MNYNDMNDEDRLLEQEQQNSSQGFDPVGTGMDVYNLNNKIKQMKASHSDRGDVPLNDDKKTPEGDIDKSHSGSDAAEKTAAEGSKGKGTQKANDIGKASSEGAKAKSAEGAAEAGKAASTAGTGTAAGATGAGATAAGGTAAAGGAAASGATAAGTVAITPVGWAIIIGVIVLLFIIIIVLVIDSAGIAVGEGTGLPENYLIGDCEEGDEECEELYEYIMGMDTVLASEQLYNKMLEYCREEQSFIQKILNLINSDNISDGCDLAHVIENKVKDKEEEINGKLSRGLIVGTLQWLYNGKAYIEDESNVENPEDSINTASPNNVLENIAASGMVTADDIEILVDYMVYKEEYTFYTWQSQVVDTEYDCKTRTNDAGEEEKYDCKTLVEYSCEEIPYKATYRPSTDKFFMFLKFGGTHVEKVDSSGKTKIYWNKTKVEEGLITIEEQKSGEYEAFDAATSFQEITNYNKAYNATSDECKIKGKAASSLPQNTDDTVYKYDENSVTDATNAFPSNVIDTTAYDIVPEDGPVQATVIGKDCKLNNIKSGDNICKLEQKELNYGDGFMYLSFPQYKYSNDKNNVTIEDYDEKQYENLGKDIEKNIEIIDSYEDHLNEVFGFDNYNYESAQYYQGITSSAFCEYQNKPVRLWNKTADPDLPGGSAYINGSYVANDTITFKDYITGVAYGEIGSYIRAENLEYLKFMILVFKSYTLQEADEKNGELYIRSDTVQAYKPGLEKYNNYYNVFNTAYSAVENKLIYEKGSQKVLKAYYGAQFQNSVLNLSKGLTYDKIIDMDYVRKYAKEEKVVYQNAEIGDCSTGISGGIYNGNIDTSWPFFPAGTNYSVSTYSMFICRKGYEDLPFDFHAAVDLPVDAGTQVTSPINGTVISSDYYSCGNGIVKVRGTIPSTGKEVVLQFTHLYGSGLISTGSNVIANQTIIGYISDGDNDRCSDGPHLDFKAYDPITNRYYNPSVLVSGIINNLTNIPTSSYINGYNGKAGPTGYDVCCSGIGYLPSC